MSLRVFKKEAHKTSLCFNTKEILLKCERTESSKVFSFLHELIALAFSRPVFFGYGSNLLAMASNLLAMASNLLAMAAMASNILVWKSVTLRTVFHVELIHHQ